MLAHRVKIEGTYYPALTLLVDSLRNERFAHSDPSREAELLSPGMKELSTWIILRKVSQCNELGAAHPAGFPSVDSLHSFMFCSFRQVFSRSRRKTMLRNSHIFILYNSFAEETGAHGSSSSRSALTPSCPPSSHPHPTPALHSLAFFSPRLPRWLLPPVLLWRKYFSIQTLFPCLSSLFPPPCKCKVGQGYFDFGHESLHSSHGFYCLS